jgi:uncharacterized membrane protein YkvA (DUF1232 family)
MADADFADKHFPRWIQSLADDVRQLAAVIARADAPWRMRVALVGAVNYMFRSLDIIPDWFPALGFVDDAMILRTGAAMAAHVDAGELAGDEMQALYRLSNEADLVKELLGEELNGKFVKYVEELPSKDVRGRNAEAVLKTETELKNFLAEVESFAKDYKPSAYASDVRYPEKIRLFVSGKLGR